MSPQLRRKPLLIERIVGLGHPILTRALNVVAVRAGNPGGKIPEKKIAHLVKGIRHYENRPLTDRIRRETSSPIERPGSLTRAQKTKLATLRISREAGKQLRKSSKKKTQVANVHLSREPMLLEFGNFSGFAPGLVGKTIAGATAVKGATSTANTAWLTQSGRANYGDKWRKNYTKSLSNKEKCYKRAGTDRKKQEKCDEVPVTIGGVSILRRTKLGGK